MTVPSWKSQFEKIASTGAECAIVEIEPGQWYGFIGPTPQDDEDSGRDEGWIDVVGPASSEEKADRMLMKRHANPGGYMSIGYNAKESLHWKKEANKIRRGMFDLSKTSAIVDPREADLKKAFLAIQRVAAGYAGHERGSTSSPAGPDTSKFRATHSGNLEPFRNRMSYGGQYGFDRTMLVGINIGSNFGLPEDYKPGGDRNEFMRGMTLQKKVVDVVKKEVKKILQKLVDKHGGFIHEFDGSNYGGLGWVAK